MVDCRLTLYHSFYKKSVDFWSYLQYPIAPQEKWLGRPSEANIGRSKVLSFVEKQLGRSKVSVNSMRYWQLEPCDCFCILFWLRPSSTRYPAQEIVKRYQLLFPCYLSQSHFSWKAGRRRRQRRRRKKGQKKGRKKGRKKGTRNWRKRQTKWKNNTYPIFPFFLLFFLLCHFSLLFLFFFCLVFSFFVSAVMFSLFRFELRSVKQRLESFGFLWWVGKIIRNSTLFLHFLLLLLLLCFLPSSLSLSMCSYCVPFSIFCFCCYVALLRFELRSVKQRLESFGFLWWVGWGNPKTSRETLKTPKVRRKKKPKLLLLLVWG